MMEPTISDKNPTRKLFFEKAKKSALRIWLTITAVIATNSIIAFLTDRRDLALISALLLIAIVTLRYWIGWVFGEVLMVQRTLRASRLSGKAIEYLFVVAAAFLIGTLLDANRKVPQSLPPANDQKNSLAELIHNNPTALACIKQQQEIYHAVLVSLAKEKWNRSLAGSN